MGQGGVIIFGGCVNKTGVAASHKKTRNQTGIFVSVYEFPKRLGICRNRKGGSVPGVAIVVGHEGWPVFRGLALHGGSE